MKHYWSIKTMPELRDLPAAERKRLWNICNAKALRDGRGKWYTVVGVLCMAGGYGLADWFSGRIAGGSRLPVYFVLIIAVTLVYLFWYAKFVEVVQRYVRHELGHLCVNCGYDLRGGTDRCPECGAVVSETRP